MSTRNSLINLAAAIFTGLGIWLLSISGIPALLRPHLFSVIVEGALVKVSSFTLAALLVSLWRHRLVARFGWVLIACLGVIITAIVDEIVLRANDPEPDFFPAVSPFPMEIVLYTIPALFFMAGVHYAGVLLSDSKQP